MTGDSIERGITYVAFYNHTDDEGRVVLAQHRRVNAANLEAAHVVAMLRAPYGWRLVSIRPATDLDHQARI